MGREVDACCYSIDRVVDSPKGKCNVLGSCPVIARGAVACRIAGDQHIRKRDSRGTVHKRDGRQVFSSGRDFEKKWRLPVSEARDGKVLGKCLAPSATATTGDGAAIRCTPGPCPHRQLPEGGREYEGADRRHKGFGQGGTRRGQGENGKHDSDSMDHLHGGSS